MAEPRSVTCIDSYSMPPHRTPVGYSSTAQQARSTHDAEHIPLAAATCSPSCWLLVETDWLLVGSLVLCLWRVTHPSLVLCLWRDRVHLPLNRLRSSAALLRFVRRAGADDADVLAHHWAHQHFSTPVARRRGLRTAGWRRDGIYFGPDGYMLSAECTSGPQPCTTE